LSLPYRGRCLSHPGPPMRVANGARRARHRPQDRFYQPYHLVRIWSIRPDMGLRVRHHGARSPAAAPGSTAPVYAGAFRRAAHRTAPSPEMDEAALFGCIDWVAQGFEIVHSVFPGWKFAPADTVIVNGLHGALLLAPHHPAGFVSATDWVSNLAGFEIDLLRDGAVVDRGHGANVLDGPLSALRHLVALLARDPVNSPLAT